MRSNSIFLDRKEYSSVYTSPTFLVSFCLFHALFKLCTRGVNHKKVSNQDSRRFCHVVNVDLSRNYMVMGYRSLHASLESTGYGLPFIMRVYVECLQIASETRQKSSWKKLFHWLTEDRNFAINNSENFLLVLTGPVCPFWFSCCIYIYTYRVCKKTADSKCAIILAASKKFN